MLKLLQTEFIINQKNKESLIYEGYIQYIQGDVQK